MQRDELCETQEEEWDRFDSRTIRRLGEVS